MKKTCKCTSTWSIRGIWGNLQPTNMCHDPRGKTATAQIERHTEEEGCWKSLPLGTSIHLALSNFRNGPHLLALTHLCCCFLQPFWDRLPSICRDLRERWCTLGIIVWVPEGDGSSCF